MVTAAQRAKLDIARVLRQFLRCPLDFFLSFIASLNAITPRESLLERISAQLDG
jgi:hypothetical protein